MTSRVAPLVVFTACMVLTVPGALLGQTRRWDSYCTSGAFQACMSVEVTSVTVPYNGFLGGMATAVAIRIRNLEGTLGSGGAWGLVGLTLSGFQAAPATAYFALAPATLEGTAAAVGTLYPPGSPLYSDAPGPWQGVWVYQGGTYSYVDRGHDNGDNGLAIVGCDPVPYGTIPYDPYHYGAYYQTCGDGWVVYSLLLPPVQFTDATTVSVWGSTGSSGVGCTFDVDCHSVVPEPVTMVLLGTGLLGLGGVALRRSRSASALDDT